MILILFPIFGITLFLVYSYVKEIDITERLSDCGTGVCTTTSDGYITTHNTQDLHRTTWMIFKIVTHSLNQVKKNVQNVLLLIGQRNQTESISFSVEHG